VPAHCRILLVEDEPLLRSALATALDDDTLRVVAAVGDTQAALAVAEPCDVLVTDLDLGGGPNGIVLAHALRRSHPDLGIVVLTSYEDPRLVGTKLQQLPPGAAYLTKHGVDDLSRLRAEIVSAAQRGSRDADHRELPQAGKGLTDTQVETMRLVAEGLTNAEIARRRVVTEKSVEVTISRILKALGRDDGSLNPRVRITRAYYALAGADARSPRRPT
jgi:DNA-binding NarL/FixJ family response regulator